MLEDIETNNTQKIADLITNEAIDNNFGVAKDDMSIIVCKFRKKESWKVWVGEEDTMNQN